MSEPIIEARGLVKRYGKVTAVDGVDLAVAPGEIYGLLGPNGSGKTTTILMLLGLTEVSQGSVRVVGLDPTREPLEVKRQVGYMPDLVGFYEHLSGRANLRFTGWLCGLAGAELEERIAAALDEVGLGTAGDRPVRTYSHGMRQRLGLAEVIVKRPRVAILDEPTNGLDPSATHEFLALVRRLKESGMTILLCSHLLDRVQAVCDRVGLFHRGKLVLEGTVAELARRVLGGADRIEVEAQGDGLDAALKAVPGVIAVERSGEGRYWLEADGDPRPSIAEAVVRAGARLTGLRRRDPSLDEIYTQYFARV